MSVERDDLQFQKVYLTIKLEYTLVLTFQEEYTLAQNQFYLSIDPCIAVYIP